MFNFTGDIALKPIIASAGQDISHWFNPKTGDVSFINCYSDWLLKLTLLW